MKIKEYRGLLAVFVAGAIGISLLCSVSGMAIQDLNESTTGVDLQPGDIVDAAVSNLNTAGALTMQAFAELIPTSTPTLRPTHTVTSFPSATVAPLTPTAFRFPTFSEPTRTRRPRPDPSNTPVPPTRTAVPPTRTPVPPTNTPVPTPTVAPTLTPADTLTPVPSAPPQDTPTVAPTITEPPPPTGPPIAGSTPTP